MRRTVSPFDPTDFGTPLQGQSGHDGHRVTRSAKFMFAPGNVVIHRRGARHRARASVGGPGLQNTHTVTFDCNRVMVRRVVIPFTAMTGPQPSARAAADPRTVRLALELLERTAGRRRRCRRCRNVIAENARKRGQAWSVCTACAQAIENETRQIEIAPALFRQCVVCQTDITHLRAGARTCADACRNVLSRILRRRRRPTLIGGGAR